jgi:methylmalonyl-CoA mutase
MGLQGMINDLVKRSDYPIGDKLNDEINHLEDKNPRALHDYFFCRKFSRNCKPILDKIHTRKMQLSKFQFWNYRNGWSWKIIISR